MLDLSWSPYSKFAVVAIIETTDHQIYSGVNIESANLSLTVHAEQSAIIAAIHAGAIKSCRLKFIKAIYVFAPQLARHVAGADNLLMNLPIMIVFGLPRIQIQVKLDF